MKNVRLLEDRVTRVVARLRELAQEKEALTSELDRLRDELRARPEPGEAQRVWAAERAEMVTALEETLAELRSGDAARPAAGS